MLRSLTILLAVIGFATAILVVATAKQAIPSPEPSQPPSTNPFHSGVACLGIVEPATRLVGVAAPEPGRVVEVFVEVNQSVARGDPLFRLDPVPLESELLRAEAERQAAAAEVARLESWPRAEDFPPAEAEVAEAASRLDDAEARLENLLTAQARGAASDDEVARQRFLTSILRASLTNAQARLARMKAGAWSQDLAVARAALTSREAAVEGTRMRLGRLTVRATIEGSILKRNIEPGEFISGGTTQSTDSERAHAPMILGDLRSIHIRAQVDEEDMPLVRPGAEAVARIRGALRIELPLTMVRIEPMAGPKRQISGASTELIDTRVVEVIYRLDLPAGAPRLYPGQVVDVYINADEPPAIKP